jgi:alpha-amylase/alpha-mannosidase (GH57 family)
MHRFGAMNERYLCIHGHFYQPPRQNPWLERLEVQDSAAPFHDWNERVTAECYAPNAAARILDGEGKILAADRASQAAHGGHGNAIAQCYNHLILPLANRRDRTTQVLWGCTSV